MILDVILLLLIISIYKEADKLNADEHLHISLEHYTNKVLRPTNNINNIAIKSSNFNTIEKTLNVWINVAFAM